MENILSSGWAVSVLVYWVAARIVYWLVVGNRDVTRDLALYLHAAAIVLAVMTVSSYAAGPRFNPDAMLAKIRGEAYKPDFAAHLADLEHRRSKSMESLWWLLPGVAVVLAVDLGHTREKVTVVCRDDDDDDA